MGNVVAQVMKSASFEGYYSNYSLRRTCATRLYDKGLPEQLIQETTGHRSANGVQCYKHTPSSAKRRATEIVQKTQLVRLESRSMKKMKGKGKCLKRIRKKIKL